jgi:hypothetical protein
MCCEWGLYSYTDSLTNIPAWIVASSLTTSIQCMVVNVAMFSFWHFCTEVSTRHGHLLLCRCRSLLELRVLLERDHIKFDHVNTSNALTQLAKLQRALHEQLSKAGLLNADSAQRHRQEHVQPCLKVLDILTKRHTEQFDAWGVSATLWAYSSLDHYDRAWFDALCSRALKLQSSMKPTDAANILTAFGRWGHYHPELIRSLPQVRCSAVQHTGLPHESEMIPICTLRAATNGPIVIWQNGTTNAMSSIEQASCNHVPA